MKIEKDKMLHFLVCCFITLLLYPIIGWWSIGTAIATGVGKELYDKHDYGVFSVGDLIADFIGVLTATIILILITVL